jgi:hypothetical protein
MNIHPGESLGELWSALTGPVSRVKRRVASAEPFGLGLRIAGQASEELIEPSQLAELGAWLTEQGMYVFTVNGFPYGAFHGQAVKEKVYLPDWSSRERVAYTNRIASILSSLLPSGVRGSISTVPLGYGLLQGGDSRVSRMAENICNVVAELWRLEQQQGKWVTLALEPEPDCLLQTTDDVVHVFERYFYSTEALRWLALRCGVGVDAAHEIYARHLGVCVDTCHAAVEFESPRAVFDTLREHGVTVAKVQLSSGLRVVDCDDEKRLELSRFDEPVYLHQVVVRRRNGVVVRYADLGHALDGEPSRDAEWRVHFHVPLHVADYGSLLSTNPFVAEVLKLHRRSPVAEHLEVETYTWDVLPDKPTDVVDSIARELTWVKEQLNDGVVGS